MAARARSCRPFLLRLVKVWTLTIPIWLASTIIYAQETIPWAAYYSAQELPQQAIRDYKLIILDADYPHDISELLEEGKTVLAYLSIGEISKLRRYFSDAFDSKYVLEENVNWPGSYKTNVRDHRWTERIVQDLIPEILRRGFSGVFLDTLDSAVDLERRDPKLYSGMRTASSQLVHSIRLNYPHIKIMVNRAYELMPDIGASIDYLLGESVYTSYNFKDRQYFRVPEQERERHVALLRSLQQKHNKLQVMTLDYWDPDDHVTVAEIYSQQSKNGFSPYVAAIELDRIITKPE